MPLHTMDLHERDVWYHRRLGIISGIVVVSMAIAVVAGQRYIHRNDALKMVGWKGDMELLPEITIEPEVALSEASTAAEARPQSSAPRTRVAVPVVAKESDFETTENSEKATRTDGQGDPLDVDGKGASVAEARPLSRPVSYSETYVILRTVKPKYPEHERERGIEGSVTVELLVDQQGLVAQANALNLIGPVSFQDSALEAVRQFEFKPPVIDGELSTMWIKFVIKFRIQN